MYIRRRPWECNIPLGGCQGHAPVGWLLPSPPALNLGTASCGAPCFEWRPVPVVGVGAHMVVGNISEFLHGLVQLLLRPEFIEVGALFATLSSEEFILFVFSYTESCRCCINVLN